jgi:Domain of unknown function (DUF4440)
MRSGMITLVTFVLGLSSATLFHHDAQPTSARWQNGDTKVLTRMLNEREEESYRAWQTKDTSFWSGFLSERFVGWGSAGRIDEAEVAREWSGTNCTIVSYRISDSEVSQLTPSAAILTHKTILNGSCDGKPLPNASWTATAYFLDGAQWKAIFRAASEIVNPANLPKQSVDAAAAGRSASRDANTEAMLSREEAIWDAWKDKDATRISALVPPEIQFINIFGTHIGTRAETLQAWSGQGCDVKTFQLSDAKATMFAPDFGILTLYATVDGTCFGQPVIPIWTSSFYVRHGKTWVWSFGINVPAHVNAN